MNLAFISLLDVFDQTLQNIICVILRWSSYFVSHGLFAQHDERHRL